MKSCRLLESPSSCFFQYQLHISRPRRSLGRFVPWNLIVRFGRLAILPWNSLHRRVVSLEKLTSIRSIEDEQYVTREINEWVQNACAHETCLTKPYHWKMFYTVWSSVCLTSFKLYQIRSNTIEQGVQTGKYLVTKQCLSVFNRQTFLVWTGFATQ